MTEIAVALHACAIKTTRLETNNIILECLDYYTSKNIQRFIIMRVPPSMIF
jgi:hypothetical protein